MMVLVAVAIGTGWLYSVAATFFIEGEVFYEAAGMLATFVLLGHWFEMRARGGANDAIRALLDLAPPMAVVLRDGEPVEVPTAEVQVGDLLLIRPGAKVPVDARSSRRARAEVDESTVTGESLPVSQGARRPSSIGATINTNGTLRARATAVGSDTALAQIVKLVQEAQNSKAPGQRLADRAAFWLVLVALVGGGRDLRRLVLRRRPRRRRRRCCSPSRSWSSPAPTRSGWRRRRRSWSAPASAPSAASSSSTRWRWSRRPRSTPSCSTRPAR